MTYLEIEIDDADGDTGPRAPPSVAVGAAITLFGRRSSLKVDQEALASNE
jgi:hypothetical protein